MTDEIKVLLEDYFLAAVNLYGIIPLWKVFEIYNNQNEPITESEFREFAENIDCSNKSYDIIGKEDIDKKAPETDLMKKELVAEYMYIDGWEEYKEISGLQEGIDYYIPKKERFLRYKDEFFYEKSMEFIDVRAFLRNLPYLSKEQADTIAEDMEFMLQADREDDIIPAVSQAIELGFKDKDKIKLQQFCGLLMDLNDNVRKHCYRGHTKKEVFGDFGDIF